MAGMLNGNGTAYAGGAGPSNSLWNLVLRQRHPSAGLVPAATGVGSAWALSPMLMPLQPVKPYLSVVTGLSIKTPNIAAHKAHPAAALTGANSAQDVQLPSIDQVLAPILNAGTMPAFPIGLHVGISNTSGAGALDLRIRSAARMRRILRNTTPQTCSSRWSCTEGHVFRRQHDGADRQARPELAHRKAGFSMRSKDDAASLRLRLGKADQLRPRPAPGRGAPD